MREIKFLFQVSAEDFKKIPGSPIVYWIGKRLLKSFEEKTIADYGYAGIGMRTGDNARFLRHWFEVVFTNMLLDCSSRTEQVESCCRWIPYNKGGEFRKWYGNNDYVVNWKNDGEEIKENTRLVYPQLGDDLGWKISNESYYYHPGITWTGVTTSKNSFRMYEKGFIFDSGANGFFPKKENQRRTLAALLNTCISQFILGLINPTINTGAGTVKKIPVIFPSTPSLQERIDNICSYCLKTTKDDWDSYETSWDFQENPLIDAKRHNDKSKNLSDLYGLVRVSWEQQCETMRKQEVENNRIFIEIYGLQDEISPDVPWDEITLTCNPWYRYGKSPELESDGQHFSTTGEPKVGTIFGMQPTGIKVSEPNQEMKVTSFPFNQELEDRLQKDTVKELISYAVGCMFGRYSLDVPGLAFAGGEWESTNYMTFQPDADNVIPILDEDWFADDIVGRFQEFLKVAFGEENFHENLTFIEAALGKDIRSYFTKDFYADHVKMYQKRPIYWLFSSPTGAFSALIYLHRYRQDTVGTVLTYLRSHITKVNAHIQEQEEIIASAKASASMKSKAVRERLKMQHELQELEDYERDVLYPLSTERLIIDLDDGVKVNYPKFGKALRPVKGLDAKEE